MKRPSIFTAFLLLASVQAGAQDTSPDLIGVEDFPFGGASAQIDWQIDATGHVRLTKDACPMCRVLTLRHYEFTVDPSVYRSIAGLLPQADIDRALAAPCTLPHAVTGWLRSVQLRHRMGNSERNTAFVRDCKSPELDGLRDRLTRASAILLEQIEAKSIEGIRRY
ncbi:MAG: hypothetical protein AB7F98_11135 [Novosphingobium sp.]